MDKLEELQKAIDEAAMAGVLMLRKSQMSFDFTAPNPHHVAYTRTNASGTVSNIAAKGAQTRKEQLGDTTQTVIGKRAINATELHKINGTHEGATGEYHKDGMVHEAVKHKGNWHLTGDYTQHEPAAKPSPQKQQVTGWISRKPLTDRHGNPLYVGDKIRAQVSTGQYGMTTIVEHTITNAHEPYGSIGVNHNGQKRLIKFDPYNNGKGYTKDNDWEHGHETWVEKVETTSSEPSPATDIKKHPQYTDSDYNYLKGKGYTDEEVKNFWDRDHASGNDPLVHKKAPPVTEVIGDPDFYKHQALIDGVHKVGNDLLNNPMLAEHHEAIKNKLRGLKANPTAKAAAQVAGDLKLIASKAKQDIEYGHQRGDAPTKTKSKYQHDDWSW